MCILLYNKLKGCIYNNFIYIQFVSSNYQDFMGNNLNISLNNNKNISNKIDNSNEINKLKNELTKANKTIEQQKLTINDLQNKLNNYNNTIMNYQNIINQKDMELNNLRTQLNNINVNNINNKNNFFNFNEMMCVNFISQDQNVHFAVPCIKANTFAEVEEKLYQQYPEYRETNNNFIANGKTVLRFKTIAENKIGNGLPVTLIVPS